ncbi:unnamed protein product [Adineta steineri]|uniref:WWE domain-containing protein n=1 Tax=Adineta steineri TaxID=433720 RepID=A0A813QHG4_9BILA|nr:unnamed protein product [Adineta steineri]CAF3759669.1 unnamed protein product [Adineta steineri]
MAGESGQWYWNAAQNPFSPNTPAQWQPYSEQDNAKIEQSLKNKDTKAELANHHIFFKERMQVHKSDFQKQRPVKRDPPPPK